MNKVGFYESGKRYQTKRGSEKVRSRGEQQIANFLYEQEIKYVYEPLLIIGEEKARPDFYLYEYGIFIEYLGMQGNKEYDEQTERKLALYEKYGIKVITLFPQEFDHFGAYIRTDFSKITKQPFPQVRYFDWKKSKKYTFSGEKIKKEVSIFKEYQEELESKPFRLISNRNKFSESLLGVLSLFWGLLLFLFAQANSSDIGYIFASIEFAAAACFLPFPAELIKRSMNSVRFWRAKFVLICVVVVTILLLDL